MMQRRRCRRCRRRHRHLLLRRRTPLGVPRWLPLRRGSTPRSAGSERNSAGGLPTHPRRHHHVHYHQPHRQPPSQHHHEYRAPAAVAPPWSRQCGVHHHCRGLEGLLQGSRAPLVPPVRTFCYREVCATGVRPWPPHAERGLRQRRPQRQQSKSRPFSCAQLSVQQHQFALPLQMSTTGPSAASETACQAPVRPRRTRRRCGVMMSGSFRHQRQRLPQRRQKQHSRPAATGCGRKST